MEFLNYLLKVSACSALFFAFYLLVLRKLTFFKINRFYLLITLLLSFTIPTLHFSVEREVEVQQPTDIVTPATSQIELAPVFGGPTTIAEIGSPIKESFDWLVLLPFCYGLIVISLLCLAIWRLVLLLKHARKNIQEVNGLKLVYKSVGFTNCSFFNYVFIDENSLNKNELQVLLVHEEIHAKQFHSIDKIILMIAKAVLWFNPIVYFYDKALEQTHEFEADEATSQNFGTEPYANLLLRLAIAKSEMPLVHNFVKSPIKERIKMLFNSKTKDMKKLIYLLALPIGLGLLWGFTVDVVEVFPKNNKINEKEFTLVIDAGHGGKDNGAQIGGFSEKAITLSMSAKIKALAEAKGIKVITTRTRDENFSLKDRAKAEGTILISLHVNSEPSNNGGKRNGIEMLTSGVYNNDFKLAKSNSITYYLYQELKNLTGIKVESKPKNTNNLLLNQSSLPGIILEMGYLTNKSDFNFITNENKQDELAKLIVDGILIYKEKQPAADEMLAKNKKMFDDFNIKYTAWKKSEKYKWLLNESKNFKARTLVGEIESLNYVKFGDTPTLDGFILKTNNKLYRIYIGREQVKSFSFKTGDKVSLYASKAEVWFDSEYPAIKPTKVTILKSVGVLTNYKNFKGGRLINDQSPKVAETTVKIDRVGNDDVKVSPYIVNKPKDIPLSDAYILLANLKKGNDSLKSYTVMGNSLFVKGNIKLNIDGFLLAAKFINVDKYSNLITAHIATLTSPDGSSLIGDEIVFDVTNKLAKTTKTKGYYKSN